MKPVQRAAALLLFAFATIAFAAGTQPPPTQTITVVAVGTYGPGAKTFPQRTVPDNITAIEVAIDATSRPIDAGVSVVMEVSYDSGVTWITYSGAIQPGEPTSSVISEMRVRISDMPLIPSRLLRGRVEITGVAFQTSMVARLWT